MYMVSQCRITIPHGVPEVGGVRHRHAGEGELAEHGLDTILLLQLRRDYCRYPLTFSAFKASR